MASPRTAVGVLRRTWALPRPRVNWVPVSVLVLVFAVFSFTASNFCTVHSVLTLLTRASILAILSIGSLLVLTVGAIDFSLGAVMAVSGIATVVFTLHGAPIWLSMVLGVGMGGAMGFVNGCLVAGLRLPSFLSTLVVATLIYGTLGVVFLGPRDAAAPPPTPPASLGVLAGDRLFRVTARDATGAALEVFPGVSWIVVVMVAVLALTGLVLRRTRHGRSLLLVGTAPGAAELSGLPVVRIRIAAFVCAGLLAGLASILLTSFMMMPPVGLVGYELQAIECAIIGGASLSGGRGSVVGTVVGCFILSTLDMGLTMTNADHLFLPMILNGVILLGTVFVDRARRRP